MEEARKSRSSGRRDGREGRCRPCSYVVVAVHTISMTNEGRAGAREGSTAPTASTALGESLAALGNKGAIAVESVGLRQRRRSPRRGCKEIAEQRAERPARQGIAAHKGGEREGDERMVRKERRGETCDQHDRCSIAAACRPSCSPAVHEPASRPSSQPTQICPASTRRSTRGRRSI